MNGKICTKGLSKSEVLAVLYNASRPLGMGFIKYNPKAMTKIEAQNELDSHPDKYFDYLHGRVMKVDLSGDSLCSTSYNEVNGVGAAEQAIMALISSGDVNPKSVQTAHEDGKDEAANFLRLMLLEKTTFAQNSIKLGLDDISDLLSLILDAKTRDESESPSFTKLAEIGQRIKLEDDVTSMLYKVGEGDAEAMEILNALDFDDCMQTMLCLDSRHLYGQRIAELYSDICGSDMSRFLYHIQMELPNQGTGQLSITGPYSTAMSEEESMAHLIAREYGKPGSFWALQNPPTNPNYQYPIKT